MQVNIEQTLRRGIEAQEEGKLKDAERFYRLVLKAEPLHSDANYCLGVLAVSANKADESLPLFKKAIKANSKKSRYWFSYIDALIKGEKFEAAEQVIEQVKKKGMAAEKLTVFETRLALTDCANQSKSTLQRTKLTFSEKRKKLADDRKKKKVNRQSGNAKNPSETETSDLLKLYKNQKYDEAEKLARSLTEKFPAHDFAWKVLGGVYQKTDRVAESLIPMQKAVQCAPQDATNHSNLGTMFQQLGELRRAEASYRQAILLKPDFAEVHFNLGITCEKLGKSRAAESAYRRAIKLKPKFTEAHNNLGTVLKSLRKLKEAETSYRKSIALSPNDPKTHYNLAVTLRALVRFEEAQAALKRAIALKPDFAEAHAALGNTLKELGKLKEAESYSRKALAIKPEYSLYCNNLGIVLHEMGRFTEAEAIYNRAIEFQPDLADAHNNLGATVQELGRFEEAEEYYMRAIELNSQFAKAYANYGNALRELGKLEEAEASFRKAVAVEPEYDQAQYSLLKCLYQSDKQSLFFNQLDYLIEQNKADSVIGSLTCRSALRYGLEKKNVFCNEPLKYVMHVDLRDQYNFKEIFVETVTSILSKKKIESRKQSLLVSGSQTSGNLFDIENILTDKIQKAIRVEIEKYRIKFENSEEGLIKKWPAEYVLYGWIISMKNGGELHPHIHDQGWLSGSVYINVPLKSNPDSGSLVVSLGEEKDVIDARRNKKEVLDVATGSLVLFPASLTHYTIPFEADEERIVLAFDVKKK